MVWRITTMSFRLQNKRRVVSVVIPPPVILMKNVDEGTEKTVCGL
jgi:hypothetical protein